MSLVEAVLVLQRHLRLGMMATGMVELSFVSLFHILLKDVQADIAFAFIHSRTCATAL